MDKSHASLSSLTFQQVHQLPEALKASNCYTYQNFNFEVESQVPRYLSQENQMDRILLNVSTFPYQKPQMNYLDSSKPNKVANRYSLMKNGC